jgi:transcriptional regulator with XRE-family HTH domain
VTDRRSASEGASDAAEARRTAAKRTFGERLRLARGKAGVSQSELSRTSGVPKTMLSRYENDHILPSVTTLKKLATALGESVSALVGNGPAVLHTFAAVLGHRGIVIGTEAEAEQLALAIATLVEAHDDRLTFLEIIEHRAELEA